jgi:hypothetical protein
MLKLPVYLYPNKLDVILDLDQNRGINNTMYQRELKIQKGITNTVQIQFKNSDQKPVDVSTATFFFSMIDTISQQLVLEKPLTILDDGTTRTLKGLAQLQLIESDTINLDSTSYTFGIKQLNPDGNTFSPTYANTYYGMSGVLQVVQDLFPVLKPSQEVPLATRLANGDPSHNMYDFWGGNVYANPELKSNTGLYTAALYLNNFAGTYSIEGTLDNEPAQPGNANANFVTITSATISTNTTGIVYVNFNGIFNYVRFKSTPAPDAFATNWYSTPQLNPATPTQFPNGKIDKVLFRS